MCRPTSSGAVRPSAGSICSAHRLFAACNLCQVCSTIVTVHGSIYVLPAATASGHGCFVHRITSTPPPGEKKECPAWAKQRNLSDNGGCSNSVRTISIRTSSDGKLWSGDLGCSDPAPLPERAWPSRPKCQAYNYSNVVRPDPTEDPPEMQLCAHPQRAPPCCSPARSEPRCARQLPDPAVLYWRLGPACRSCSPVRTLASGDEQRLAIRVRPLPNLQST